MIMHSSYHLVKGLIGIKGFQRNYVTMACRKAKMVSDMFFQTIEPTKEDKYRDKPWMCKLALLPPRSRATPPQSANLSNQSFVPFQITIPMSLFDCDM